MKLAEAIKKMAKEKNRVAIDAKVDGEFLITATADDDDLDEGDLHIFVRKVGENEKRWEGYISSKKWTQTNGHPET